MCINNKDILGTISESNGRLKVKEVKINQDEVLIAELKAMRENPNRTVIDMERLFEEYYPSDVHTKTEFNYLYPIEYSNAYVCRAKYPVIISTTEYNKRIKEVRQKTQWSYLESPEAKDFLDKLKERSVNSYQQEILKRERLVQKEVDELKGDMKKNFRPERFIYAYNYYKKAREVAHDKNVKMITTDTLGWTDFSYQVNEDVEVYMKTNFGYGRSSYFFSNIIYKGVSILPYTAVVNYYYVNWTDFIRYTNRYSPNRDNWDYALNFIVDTANLAKSDPNAFLEKWVVNELKEMMIGLRKVMNSKDADLEKYLNIRHEHSISSYSLVRDCYNGDITEYEVLPQEKVMAFKAEKITGCLYLLDNMSQFTAISSYVQKCIDEIEGMNKNILSEIKETLKNIASDINRLQKQLDSLNKKISDKQPALNSHKANIEKILKKMNAESKVFIHSFYAAETKYKQGHPEYVKLLNELKDLKGKADEKQSDISLRQSFETQLNKCLKRICSYFEIAS